MFSSHNPVMVYNFAAHRARKLFISILIQFQLVHTSSCAKNIFSFLAHMLTPSAYTEKTVSFSRVFFCLLGWVFLDLTSPSFAVHVCQGRFSFLQSSEEIFYVPSARFDLLFLRVHRSEDQHSYSSIGLPFVLKWMLLYNRRGN